MAGHTVRGTPAPAGRVRAGGAFTQGVQPALLGRRPAGGAAYSHTHPACHEWALRVPDTGAELYERQVMLGAISACRSAAAPESYTAFRRLLIERPVLTRGEMALLHGNPDLLPVVDLLREAYRPAPAGSSVGGSFAAC
jgi:pPIWI_RE three-gene island domain Y